MLETKDLILRQGAADDWQDLYRNLWSREEVFLYMFNKACSSAEQAKIRTAAYAQMHEEVKTEFFVCEKASGQLALSCGFTYSHFGEAELMKNGKKIILDYYFKPIQS